MTNPTGEALKASAAQVRHKKRGSTYNVIGIGKMQSEHWWERNSNKGQATFGECDQLIDMREVVVYRSTEDGSLWVRPREEFEDGRFEPALSPAEQAPQPRDQIDLTRPRKRQFQTPLPRDTTEPVSRLKPDAIAYDQRSDSDFYRWAMAGYNPATAERDKGALQRYAAKHSAETRRRLFTLISNKGPAT